MNSKRSPLVSKIAVVFALFAYTVPSLQAFSLPSWVISKVLNTFTGAVYNELGGFFTRDGLSLAQAGQVQLNAAESGYVEFYENAVAHTGAATREDFEKPTLTYGTGSDLMSRKFSYHDWLYYDQYDSLGKASPTKRVSGKGIHVPALDSSDYLQFGRVGVWNANFVVHSVYSNPTGDQDLRKPGGEYIAEIQYRISDLDYNHVSGISSTPKNYLYSKVVVLDKIAKDSATIDLLPDNTELNGRANAYGVCRRTWRLQTPEWDFWDLIQTERNEWISRFVSECEWVVNEETGI